MFNIMICNITKIRIRLSICTSSEVVLSSICSLRPFFLITWFTDLPTRFFRIWKNFFLLFSNKKILFLLFSNYYFFLYKFSVVGPNPG